MSAALVPLGGESRRRDIVPEAPAKFEVISGTSSRPAIKLAAIAELERRIRAGEQETTVLLGAPAGKVGDDCRG